MKIKRCPFCGGKARHFVNYFDQHVVYCVKCEAETGHEAKKKQAIKAWNKRK